MSRRFYLGDTDSSDSDDGSALPYPQPLARSAFLAPDFSPTTFLSSLRNRHQTLEDLIVELRNRSQELNKELLDLVNENYQDFLGLGVSLKGGEERVEEVKLGLFRFRVEIDRLKEGVSERRKEVEELVETRRRTAQQLRMGKALLDVDARLEELEESLRIRANESNGQDGDSFDPSDSEGDSEDEEDTAGVVSTSRLKRKVQQYICAKRMIEKIGPCHPFLQKQDVRVQKIRQTLLLDLRTALGQFKGNDVGHQVKTLNVLALYRDMGESAEALQTIRETKKR